MRKRSGLKRILLVFFLLESFLWSQDIASLRADLNSVKSEIASAQMQSEELEGGLIQVLIGVRIEILKTTVSLIEQRIHAVESNSPITIEIPATQPDEELARRLEIEINKKQLELSVARDEAGQYGGGLVAVMKLAMVATLEQSLAMLEQEYLRAHYGLAFPSIPKTQPTSVPISEPGKDSDVVPEDNPERQVLLPLLSNKRFAKQDYQDYIWFDVEWKALGLKKKSRAIKGTLIFHDLFGERKFAVRMTIDDSLEPGQSFLNKGIGFKYSMFDEAEKWVRMTDLDDMLIQFEVKSIIYSDGEREDF